jgi:hypothetical protein
MKRTSSAMRGMLAAARRRGLCCVALFAWIKYRGYRVAELQALTDAQCREITARMKAEKETV